MNCLEFRRHKLAAPKDMVAEAREHESACPGCAEFVRKANQFERELAMAIAVPVPENLAERVLLSHGLKQGYRARVMGIAASLLLVTALTFSAGYYASAPSAYVLNESIKHVQGEPAAMTAHQVVNRGDMEQALARSGATLVADVSTTVSYLHDCPVPGGYGKHIVLQTAQGKVTVITMPNQRVMRKGTLESGGLIAAVMPAGRGSFAIIAPSRVSLAAAEQTLQQYISWSA